MSHVQTNPDAQQKETTTTSAVTWASNLTSSSAMWGVGGLAAGVVLNAVSRQVIKPPAQSGAKPQQQVLGSWITTHDTLKNRGPVVGGTYSTKTSAGK